jgi:hypothetical protein
MANRGVQSLEEEARHLVKLNHSEVRSIVESYVFPDPDGKEIRVVHVDTKAFPEKAVIPISFAPDPTEGLNHQMQIAIVDPVGIMTLTPPEGWGSWGDAMRIERKHRSKAS